MANLEANPSNFIGQPWSVLFEHFDSTKKEKPPEAAQIGTDGETVIDRSKSDGWSMKLRKEDARTFGVCPSLDECYLAVCEHCGAVIKPQALLNHINMRHKESSDEQSIKHLRTQKPVVKSGSGKSKTKPSVKLSTTHSSNVLDKYGLLKPPPLKLAGYKSTANLSNSVLALHLSHDLSQPVVALSDVSPINTRSCKDSSSTPNSTTTGKIKKDVFSAKRSLDADLADLKLKSSPTEQRLSSIMAEIVEKVGVQSRIPSPPVIQQTQHVAPKASTKSSNRCIPCKDREYDPDRHCGCWLDDWGKHCTRSLTCKTHALSLRRKVQGRSKPFDQLLQEHRDLKKASQLAKALNQQQGSSTAATQPGQIAALLPSLHSPALPANIANFRVSQKQAQSKPAVSSPFDDFEMDGPTETNDKSFSEKEGYTTYHPRPLAVQSYGFRLCGTSFVPNKKMDLLRMAFQCAIEQQPPKKKTCYQIPGIATTSISYGQEMTLPTLNKSVKNKHSSKSIGGKKKKKSKTAQAAEPQQQKSQPSYAQPINVVASSASNLGNSISNANLLTTGNNGQLVRARLGVVTSINDTSNTTGGKDQSVNQQLLLPTDIQVNGGVDKTANAFVLTDGGKAKLTNGGIHLTTNASSIGALNKQKVALLDGLPCTLYAARQASGRDSSMKTGAGSQALLLNGDLFTRAANSSGVLCNPQTGLRQSAHTTIFGLVPQQNSSLPQNLQQLKAEGIRDNSNLATHHIIQGNSGTQLRHLTLTNGTNVRASITPQQMIAMQQLAKQNKTTPVSLTIPLVPSATLAQQQTLHKATNAPKAAAAAAVPSNYT